MRIANLFNQIQWKIWPIFLDFRPTCLFSVRLLASGSAGLVLFSERGGRELASQLLRLTAGIMAFFLLLKWIYLSRSSELFRPEWVSPFMVLLFAAGSALDRKLAIPAACLTLLGALWTELAFVVSGQMQAPGPKTSWVGTVQSYAPNLAETGILSLGLGTALLAFITMKMLMPYFAVRTQH